jgi:ubiquitin-specific protease-like protein/BTB/POZ domain-containing protein
MPSWVLDDDNLEELTKGVRELFPVQNDSLRDLEVHPLYASVRTPLPDDKRKCVIFKCPSRETVHRPSASRIVDKVSEYTPCYIHRCSVEECDGHDLILLFVRWFDPLTFELSGARVLHANPEDHLGELLQSAATHFGVSAEEEVMAWQDVAPTRGCRRIPLSKTVEERLKTGDVIVLQKKSDTVYFDEAADCITINGSTTCDELSASFTSHVAKLLASGLCGDVLVLFGPSDEEKQRQCHRAILAQSPFFKKALTDPSYDLTSGTVTLPSNLDPVAVTFVLEVLYGQHTKWMKCLECSLAIKVLVVFDYLVMDSHMDLLLSNLDLSRAAPSVVTDALALALVSSKRDQIIRIVAKYTTKNPKMMYEYLPFADVLVGDAEAFRTLAMCMYDK